MDDSVRSLKVGKDDGGAGDLRKRQGKMGAAERDASKARRTSVMKCPEFDLFCQCEPRLIHLIHDHLLIASASLARLLAEPCWPICA